MAFFGDDAKSEVVIKLKSPSFNVVRKFDTERSTSFPLKDLLGEAKDIMRPKSPPHHFKEKEAIELKSASPFFTANEKVEKEWKPSRTPPQQTPDRDIAPMKFLPVPPKLRERSKSIQDIKPRRCSKSPLPISDVKRVTFQKHRSRSEPSKALDNKKEQDSIPMRRFTMKLRGSNALSDIFSSSEKNIADEQQPKPFSGKTSKQVQKSAKSKNTNTAQKHSDNNRNQASKPSRKSNFTKFDIKTTRKLDHPATNERKKIRIDNTRRQHSEKIKTNDAPLIQLQSVKKIKPLRNTDRDVKTPTKKSKKSEKTCNRKNIIYNYKNAWKVRREARKIKETKKLPQPIKWKPIRKTVVTPFSFAKREEEFCKRREMRAKISENKKYEIKRWARPPTILKKKPFKIQPSKKNHTVVADVKLALDERQKKWEKFVKEFGKRQERRRREKQRRDEAELKIFRKKLIPKIHLMNYEELGITPKKTPFISPFRKLREESAKIYSPFRKLKHEEKKKISKKQDQNKNDHIKDLPSKNNLKDEHEINNSKNYSIPEQHMPKPPPEIKPGPDNKNIRSITKQLISSINKKLDPSLKHDQKVARKNTLTTDKKDSSKKYLKRDIRNVTKKIDVTDSRISSVSSSRKNSATPLKTADSRKNSLRSSTSDTSRKSSSRLTSADNSRKSSLRLTSADSSRKNSLRLTSADSSRKNSLRLTPADNSRKNSLRLMLDNSRRNSNLLKDECDGLQQKFGTPPSSPRKTTTPNKPAQLVPAVTVKKIKT